MEQPLPQVTKEFLEGSKIPKIPKKKGGPYSKKDRDLRREKISKLHFEYGYSAVKISDMLDVNRNTINRDIEFLYSSYAKNWRKTPIVSMLQRNLLSLEAQKSRLREEIDNVGKLSEKLAIEKLLLQISTKIQNFQIYKGQFGYSKIG